MGLWRIAGIAVIVRNRRDRGGSSLFFGSSTPGGGRHLERSTAITRDSGDLGDLQAGR
jgi:hypothetical protein